MNQFLIVLLIIGVYILSKNKKLYEGVVNQDKKDEGEDKKDEGEDKKDECPYRKKSNLGKMCNEKWGQPDCNSWEKTENVKNLEKNKINVLKGYYSNDFMYEVDYETYPTILTEDSNIEEIDEKTPRGIHSSFFS